MTCFILSYITQVLSIQDVIRRGIFLTLLQSKHNYMNSPSQGIHEMFCSCYAEDDSEIKIQQLSKPCFPRPARALSVRDLNNPTTVTILLTTV